MKNFFHYEIFSIGSVSITVREILYVILILFSAYVLIRILASLVQRRFQRKSRPDGRHASLTQLIKYLVWTIALVFTFQTLGVNITFLIASSAALLVGIGLGLQNLFKDFISGIALLIERTIKVDDIVEVDGMVAKVNEISLRTSKVTTRDDNVLIVPNHKFIEEKFINWTNNMLPTRFMIDVGVDFSMDPDLVEKVLMDVALRHKDVLHDKDYYPSVRLKDFGDSSLDFQLAFVSYNLFYIENVRSHLRILILKEFRNNNILIPFPQRVLHYAAEPVFRE